MKRSGPMFTLLAGIVVAAVLFMLMQFTGESRSADDPIAPDAVAGLATASAPPAPAEPADPPAAEPAVEPPPVSRVPLAAPAAITATWAGRLRPGTLAVSAKDGTAIAYLCDGKRVEAWLKGTAADGRLELSGAKGASLTGRFDERRAQGTVRVGKRTWTFAIAAVRKPSGLYRAARNVRGAKVVGGWIVLADGSQVGLGSVNGAVRQTSGLDLATGTATIDGVTVSPARTEGLR